MKAHVLKGSIFEERDWTARGCVDARRLGAKPVYTVTLEISCDTEAAQAFANFLRQQFGYDMQTGDQAEPKARRLPKATRLLGDGSKE